MGVGKQLPNLKLVPASREDEALRGDASSPMGFRASAGFDFVSLSELSPKERETVDRLVEANCPKAGLIAVARANRVWDLRPVVALANENGPSVLRTVGPRVAFNAEISARVRETFQRLERFDALPSELRSWGDSEGQLYFRRTLVPDTLAHLLSASGDLTVAPVASVSFSDEQTILALIRQLIEQVRLFHSHGVVHGHLTTSNIFIAPSGQASFLDAGIGAALIQAGFDDGEQKLQSAAPELFKGALLTPSADIYGLGQVLRRMLMKLRQHHQFTPRRGEVDAIVDRFTPLVAAMIAEDRAERPSLADIAKAFESAVPPKSKAPKHSTANAEQEQAAPQGRIVRTGAQVAQQPAKQSVQTPPAARRGSGVHSRKVIDEEFGIDIDEQNDAEANFTDTNFTDTGLPGSADWMSDELDVPSKALIPGSASDDGELDIELPSEAPSRKRVSQTNLRAAEIASKTSANWWVYLIGALSVTFCCWTFYQNQHQLPNLEPDEMRRAWDSGIPSRMLPVAELAAERGGMAEDLVISSARGRGAMPAGINQRLIRIAFDNRWEAELDDSDRRLAMTLGLAGLLGSRLRTELPPLDQAHPGVLLALAASAGENANRVLGQLPTAVLKDARLPMPFRLAFSKLSDARRGSTLADSDVQLLARFGTAGRVEEIADLVTYLKGDDGVKLQALALMFALENESARHMLDILLNHPNLVFEQPQVAWGRVWNLTGDWTELDPADQFFVLAGIAPRAGVSIRPANLGKMFSHPSPEIRKYAVERAFDQIKFNHPATGDVFLELAKRPEALSGTQLFSLALFLGEQPKDEKKLKDYEVKLKEWFASEPPPWLIQMIVLKAATHPQALAAAPQATLFDTYCAIYLRQLGWEPTAEELNKLIGHPDQYTRLFAHNQILKRFKGREAEALVKTALSKETDAQSRARLEEMLRQLTDAPA